MTSIVVGYVDSTEGEAAIDAAVAEARRRGLPLVVVHSSSRDQPVIEGEGEKAEPLLDRLRKRLEAEEVPYDVREFVLGNRPSQDLISAVEEFDAELLVIGIRRRSSTGKLILGSNALEILHDADVPVLCVKAT